MLVYRAGTEGGSSGGLILKTVDKPVAGDKSGTVLVEFSDGHELKEVNKLDMDMVPVGLHTGGYERTNEFRGCNFGSPFTDIIKSIEKEWHPPGNCIRM